MVGTPKLSLAKVRVNAFGFPLPPGQVSVSAAFWDSFWDGTGMGWDFLPMHCGNEALSSPLFPSLSGNLKPSSSASPHNDNDNSHVSAARRHARARLHRSRARARRQARLLHTRRRTTPAAQRRVQVAATSRSRGIPRGDDVGRGAARGI